MPRRLTDSRCEALSNVPPATELLMPGIATADYWMIGIYMLLMVAIGVYFLRFIHDIRAYYAGQNQIPWWVAGISFYMSGFSTYIFVAYAGRTYQWGWPAITMLWAVVPAYYIAGLVFARYWRRAALISPVEFLQSRYHEGVRQLYVWARMPVQLIDNGARVFALAFFVHTATGLALNTSILACGIITLSYTLLGGLWAVTVTDVVQFIVLLAATIVLVPLSLHAVGGWSSLVAALPDGHLQLFNEHMKPGFWLAFLAVMIVAFNSNWALVQRFYCVPDERSARRVALLAGTLYIFTMPVFMFPSLVTRAMHPDLAHPDQAFVFVAREVLPAGMMGLVLAAMFAATMSALDSEYNVLGSVLTRDVYQRFVRPHAGRRELMHAARAATALVGVVPIVLAFVLVKRHGLFDTVLATFGITGGPMAIPLLGGLVYRRGTAWGAVASLVAGTAVGAGLMFGAGLSYQWYAAGSIVTSIAAYVIVSELTPPTASRRQSIQAFFDRLSRPVDPPLTPTTGPPSPFGIVGVVTLGLGGALAFIGLANRQLGDRILCGALGGALAMLGAALMVVSLLHRPDTPHKDPGEDLTTHSPTDNA